MSAWDIDPASVGSIIESEKNNAEQSLSPALTGLSSSAEGIVGACSTGDNGLQCTAAPAPLVAAAIGEWFSSHKPTFDSIGTTVSNVLGNTVHAVDAYIRHDEDSALVYQRQAK